MLRIPDILRWEYRVGTRHYLLLLALIVGGVHTFIVVWAGKAIFELALAATVAVGIIIVVIRMASQSERWTIAAWGTTVFVGLYPVIQYTHAYVAPQMENFAMNHPVGVALETIRAVALVLVILVLVMLFLSWIGQKARQTERGDGSGGATPEERVLTDEEYADFEPVYSGDGRVQSTEWETPRAR